MVKETSGNDTLDGGPGTSSNVFTCIDGVLSLPVCKKIAMSIIFLIHLVCFISNGLVKRLVGKFKILMAVAYFSPKILNSRCLIFCPNLENSMNILLLCENITQNLYTLKQKLRFYLFLIEIATFFVLEC